MDVDSTTTTPSRDHEPVVGEEWLEIEKLSLVRAEGKNVRRDEMFSELQCQQ